MICAMLVTFVLILFYGCKTRQVVNQKHSTDTRIEQEQSSRVTEKSSETETDKSTRKEQTTEESEGQSQTSLELEIDSIKTDIQGNTIIYPKPGTKTKINQQASGATKKVSSTETQNDKQKDKVADKDSTGSNSLLFDQEIDDNNKHSDAQGSGQMWPWVVGVMVIIILFIVFIRPPFK